MKETRMAGIAAVGVALLAGGLAQGPRPEAEASVPATIEMAERNAGVASPATRLLGARTQRDRRILPASRYARRLLQANCRPLKKSRNRNPNPER